MSAFCRFNFVHMGLKLHVDSVSVECNVLCVCCARPILFSVIARLYALCSIASPVGVVSPMAFTSIPKCL